MRKRFGELLLERGLITQEQLRDALAYQSRHGIRLGAALVARGYLKETQLVAALGEALRVPVVSLRNLDPSPAALEMVGLRLCSEHDLFPYALRRERGRQVLTVATSDPLNFRLLDELGFMTNCTIEAVLAPASDIDLAIRTHYGPRLGRAYLAEEVRLALEDDADGSEMTIYRRGGGVEIINTQTGPIPVTHSQDVPPEPSTRSSQTLPPVPRPTGDVPQVRRTQEMPPVPRPPRPPRGDSALLLTEEVPDETPVDTTAPTTLPTEPPIPLTQPKAAPATTPPVPAPASSIPHTPVRPIPVQGGGAPGPATAPMSYGGAPVAPQMNPGSSPPVPTAPMTSGAGQPGFDDALGALIDAATEADHAEAILRLERKFWALMRVLAKKGLLTNEDFLEELGEEAKWRKS